MRPLRLLIALALAAAGLVLVGSPASACSCQARGLEARAAAADVVFSGVLVAEEESRRETTYRFQVERVYQGHPAESPVDIVDSRRNPCGLAPVRLDRAYIVFASDQATSDLCSGTARATPAYVADVERVLGEGNPMPSDPEKEPAPDPEFTRVGDVDSPEFTRIAAPGGAMVLLGLLGLVLFRKRG